MTSEHQQRAEPAWVEEAVRLYQSGLSVRELRLRVGKSHKTLLKHLHNRGVIRGQWEARRIRRASWAEQAVALYREGRGAPDIARRLGVSPRSVYDELHRHGIVRDSKTATELAQRAGRKGPPPGIRKPTGQLSASTAAAYQRRWDGFARWCTARGLASLPAQPPTLAAYLADLREAGRSERTIRGIATAIRRRHEDNGLPLPQRWDSDRGGVRGAA